MIFGISPGNKFETFRYHVKSHESVNLGITPGYAIVEIPYRSAVSLVNKNDPHEWKIQRIDAAGNKVADISKVVGKSDLFTWTSQDVLLMADGPVLYFKQIGKKRSGEWQSVKLPESFNDIKKISRVSVNAKNNKIAIVVEK